MNEPLEFTPCPACGGFGRQPEWNTSGDDRKCDTCQGLREVILNAVCCCGRSALWQRDGHLFCGNDICLRAIRAGWASRQFQDAY